MPSLTISTAITAAAMPLTEPTDRSICPSSSTSTMPSAMMPIGAAYWVIETMLRDDRNRTLSR